MEEDKPPQNNFTIFAVVIGVGLIAVALVYSKFSDSLSAGPPASYNKEIVLPEDITDCAKGQSCIVVETSCDFSCEYVAINSLFEHEFDLVFNQHCSRYKGKMRNCFDLSSYPSCVEEKCILVKWPDVKWPRGKDEKK